MKPISGRDTTAKLLHQLIIILSTLSPWFPQHQRTQKGVEKKAENLMWDSELMELAKKKSEVFIDYEEDDKEGEVVEKGFN